jgi:enterochelin esterase-like enzyme
LAIRRRDLFAPPAAFVVSPSFRLAAFVAVGLFGAYRYMQNFWLYRGFAPPKDPAWVTSHGTIQQFSVASAALGGRAQQVIVYLPPGYAQQPQRRYPVMYLLHGFPGRPAAFLQTVKAGVDEDVLVAQHRMQPMILVMPSGSTGTFVDEEWANGIGANAGWETFVARDLVRAIDARYRTIPSGAGRALAGLSEGGYGALNIGLHHPDEFRVLESWSGYEVADPVRTIFGRAARRIAYNSPLVQLPKVAAALRRNKTYVWFYSGTGDGARLNAQNAQFAAALARAGIARHYSLVHGGHTWTVWRNRAPLALLAAASHVSHA